MSNLQVRGHAYALAFAAFAYLVATPIRAFRASWADAMSAASGVRIQARGERSMIAGAILIPVSVLLSAVLLPPAFQQIYGANTSGWNSAVVTVFQILFPVLTVIAIAYSYVKEITG